MCYYLMCVGVLPDYLPGAAEDIKRTSGIEVIDSCELPCGSWEWSRASQEQLVLLAAKPYF